MKLIRPQLLQVACVAVVALCVNAPSLGAEPSVVGNWKLVSFVTEELATGKKTALLGEHPKGYLIYTPQGRMMGVMVHETRSAPKVDEDSDKLVHHVDVSWNEAWTGTDQVRFVKVEGDRLTITTAPAKSAITGAEVTGVVVFEREH